MLSRKRISLLLAVTFVASLLAVIATTLSRGQTTPSNNPSITVLRHKGQRNLPPTAAEIASFRRQLPKEERTFEDEIPKHVPIKIKLKSEKEKAFKDLNNIDWHRDFELEVTNTSDKPIYFLELWLVLPETKSENDVQLAFRCDMEELILFTSTLGLSPPMYQFNREKRTASRSPRHGSKDGASSNLEAIRLILKKQRSSLST